MNIDLKLKVLVVDDFSTMRRIVKLRMELRRSPSSKAVTTDSL
jgi:hypothetical protein